MNSGIAKVSMWKRKYSKKEEIKVLMKRLILMKYKELSVPW